MTQKTNEWNVLSDDQSNNVLETSELITSVLLQSRMGMWGEAMFGDFLVLGSGFNNTYLSNTDRSVASNDLSSNVTKQLSTLVTVSLLTRPGMWGEVRFGDEDLLGTGTLNYYEG